MAHPTGNIFPGEMGELSFNAIFLVVVVVVCHKYRKPQHWHLPTRLYSFIVHSWKWGMVLNAFNSPLSQPTKVFSRLLLLQWMSLMLTLIMDPSCKNSFTNLPHTESKSPSTLRTRADGDFRMHSHKEKEKALTATSYGLWIYLWLLAWILFETLVI